VRGGLAARGRAVGVAEPISYRPVRDTLRQVAALAAQHPRVQEVLRGSLYVRQLLEPAEAGAVSAADPALLQLELLDEVTGLLAALAGPDRPLALLFDDLHAADEA